MNLIILLVATLTFVLVFFLTPNNTKMLKIALLLASVVQLSRATLGYIRHLDLYASGVLIIMPCFVLSCVSIMLWRKDGTN